MGMDGRQRADYGLDAPPVVRNLLIAGIGGLVVRGTAAARLWSGDAGFTVARDEVRVGMPRPASGSASDAWRWRHG